MIRLEYNTKVQELWIPRSSTGSGDVRKTYKDGYKDGFDEGLRSSKIKLYDGMGISYSRIYDWSAFDFSDVKNGRSRFTHLDFYYDDASHFDFSELYNQLDDRDEFMYNSIFKDGQTVVVRAEKEKPHYFFSWGGKGAIGYIYQNYETTSLYFIALLFKETHLFLNTSKVTDFSGFFRYSHSPIYYINGLDMTNEEYTDSDIFNSAGEITDFYLDADTVPTSTMERLQNALVKETSFYNNTVFHYGKERWTWDSENNEWAITGYDE